MSKEESKYLVSIGLDFPSTNEELTAFEKVFGNETSALNENEIDPFKILDAINKSTINEIKTLNPSQSYFRRAVLAAKIAHEYHQEWTFGVVKMQKLVYLSEQISEMKFIASYGKYAAEPMDHRFIHSIKKEFEKQGWFSVHREGVQNKWVFTPLENILNYETYYVKYFGKMDEDIRFLIESFRKWKTVEVELVATLYACWKEAKNENSIISDQLLIQKVYGWHEDKKKFVESEIIKKIRWMEEKGVLPY